MIRSLPTKYKGLLLVEFQMMFMNDEDCAKHLMAQRWGNDFVCQKYGNKKWFLSQMYAKMSYARKYLSFNSNILTILNLCIFNWSKAVQ